MAEDPHDRAARAQLAEARLKVLMAVMTLAAMAWALIPEWRQRQLVMRLAMTARKLLDSCAKHAGHASMGTELRAGYRDYNLPYALSVLRDMAAVWYERTRDAA